MKKIVALLCALTIPARAHESLVPHVHPHGLSMLPGIDAVIFTLLALVVASIAYRKFVRVP
jgi:hypothetical protein